jgi:hypothetical protein
MPVRSQWVVKKRGVRSTTSSLLGYWSELLLSLCMVLVGGVALALHISQVLVPEWRRTSQLDELKPITCRVVDKRIEERSILGGAEYAPSLKVEFIDPGTTHDPVWTTEGFALYSPHRDEAQQILNQYKVGDTLPCWYDPEDLDPVVLGRRFRWWPWPVALLPASLLAVGIWGIVATLLQVTTTAERRSLVSQRVQQLDPLSVSTSDSGLDVSDSFEHRGTRLAYRLPIDNAPNWRLVGMIFVNTLWNTLLIYFGYVATLSWMRGNPRWLASWLVLGLGAVGIWLAFRLVQELWATRQIGITQVEVSHHPLVPGQPVRVFLQQTGRGKLLSLSVELVCEEHAMFRQGTDSRQWVECVHHQLVSKWKRLDIEPGQPFDAEFTLKIASDAMHSFVAMHNQIRWWLVVKGAARRNRTFQRRFPIEVQPAEVAIEPNDIPAPREATS